MIEHLEFNDRAARLAEIKREIAAGRYETEWRLSLAVDALWEEIVSEEPADEGSDFDPLPRKPR